MKYCDRCTIMHNRVSTFPLIVEDIYDIFQKDGCELSTTSPFFGENYMVINGDELERNFCFLDGRNLSTKKKSVDIIFLVKDVSNKQEVIFVELKLNSKENFHKLNKSSFRDKTDNSKKAMGNTVAFSRKYYIIFNSKVINEAKRFLYRQNPRLNNDFVALTTIEIFNKFFN